MDGGLTARELDSDGSPGSRRLTGPSRIDGHYVVGARHAALRRGTRGRARLAPGSRRGAPSERLARARPHRRRRRRGMGRRGAVGLAALDVRPVGGDMERRWTSPSCPVGPAHRGRGTARQLIAMLAEHATAWGATTLYISATPTCNTVDADAASGARLADRPDPAMLALEPDDIHLLLPL